MWYPQNGCVYLMQIVAQACADHSIEFKLHRLLPGNEMKAESLNEGTNPLRKHGIPGLRAEQLQALVPEDWRKVC
jgi:hypothetical protein